MQETYLSKAIFSLAKNDYLSKDDLLKVIRKYHRSKNEEERNRLRDIVVYNNLRFVIKLSHAFAIRSGTNPDDLFQNGIIGIIVALDKFKSRKGFAFSTYAMHWVNKYIRDAAGLSDLINTKRYMGQGVAVIYKQCIADSDGDPEKFKRLLRKRGIDQKKQTRIEDVIDLTHETSFLDLHQTIGGKGGFEGRPVTLADLIEDKNAERPDKETENNILQERLHHFIDTKLTPIERETIHCLYFKDMGIVKTADVVGKSRTGVQIVEKRAIRKLIKYLDNKAIFIKQKNKEVAANPIKEIMAPGKIKSMIQKFNTDHLPVSEVPLKRYEMINLLDPAKVYRVMAPTSRAAVNFLRENSRLYSDIGIVTINKRSHIFPTSNFFSRDMTLAERSRLKEEVMVSRWENGSI